MGLAVFANVVPDLLPSVAAIALLTIGINTVVIATAAVVVVVVGGAGVVVVVGGGGRFPHKLSNEITQNVHEYYYSRNISDKFSK